MNDIVVPFIVRDVQSQLYYIFEYNIIIYCMHNLMLMQRATPTSEAIDRKNNYPHILMFSDDYDITRACGRMCRSHQGLIHATGSTLCI